MNIFVTEEDPGSSASALDDRRLVKMVLETAQLLSTAVRLSLPTGEEPDRHLYKATHANHPCSLWTRATRENFCWLYIHGVALACEYRHRFGRDHASLAVVVEAGRNVHRLPVGQRTPFADCSGVRGEADVFLAYRACLRQKWGADAEAGRAPRWTRRGPPTWVEG